MMEMSHARWSQLAERVAGALEDGCTDEVADLVTSLELAVGVEPWPDERTPVVVARRFARAHAAAGRAADRASVVVPAPVSSATTGDAAVGTPLPSAERVDCLVAPTT